VRRAKTKKKIWIIEIILELIKKENLLKQKFLTKKPYTLN
jgi:hypothetical protein